MAAKRRAVSGSGNGGTPRHDAPRVFCGDGYPWPLIAELSDGLELIACYFVRDKKRLETRHNKPYLKLTLGDRTGEIVGNVWDDVDRLDGLCPPDGVVGVRGKVSLYQERLQIRVDTVQPLHADADDLERLLPASRRDRTQMERELDALVESVGDEPLRALLRRCLGKGTELGRCFRTHPAAKRNHHGYLCGLLEHSLSVATACDRLAAHYAAQDVELDRDLLITGALLHDIGKVRELKALPSSGYTTEGQLLGHIVLGIGMVAREAGAVDGLPEERLLLLQHLIASHQGRPEWDSPKVPQIREAILLHYADDLDAKLNQASALLDGVAPGEWSAYDRGLERSLFQPPAMPQGGEVEAVPSEEAVELLIDLFRG
jgi:3'-5' exoribonuclease